MFTLGCMMHWYESMMFTVPTGAVGVWGWWSSRRANKQGGGGDALAEEDSAERDDVPLLRQ